MVCEVLVVKLLANPVALRALLVLFAAGFALVFMIAVMRRLRRNIDAEAELDSTPAPTLEGLPVHLYNTVIQQLKQQKYDLQVQTLTEQRRARTSENFSQAVLSNLASGVLVFGTNGLVKQANPAAKQILGFNSLFGMSAENIFRGSHISSHGSSIDEPVRLVDEVDVVLREGSHRRHIEANYTTPAGNELQLAVTISPISAVDGNLLGIAILISDRSEVEKIHQQQQLQNEISAEMALQLRTSLTTISGYAQRLAHNNDPGMASQLAADIADEAASLDRRIGGFLAEKSTAVNAASEVRITAQTA
jgi:PAS domain S-box-containing protein